MRLNRKIKFPLLILSIILFLNQNYYPQDFRWGKISVGVDAQYLIPSGDLKSYWGNTIGVGLIGQYYLSETFTFEGGLTISSFKPQPNEKNLKLPKIILFNMPVGIKYNIGIFDRTVLTINPGFQNNMFLFTGEAAEIISENDIEHEFGVFVALGLEYRYNELLRGELYFKKQTIFSHPCNILINYIGLKIFFL